MATLTRRQFNDIINGANKIYPGIFGTENMQEELYVEYKMRASLRNKYLNKLLKKNKCIKIFAISEAPQLHAAGTYFYDPTHVNPTPWYRVPLKYHFPTHPYLRTRTVANKTTALDDLAGAGFYLEDISPAPFLIKPKRNSAPFNRFRKLIEFLYCAYFLPHVIPTICPLLCKEVKTVLMGTKVTDRILYDMITTGKPCPMSCKKIGLKSPGICSGLMRPVLSSACATNGPILRFFTCAVV